MLVVFALRFLHAKQPGVSQRRLVTYPQRKRVVWAWRSHRGPSNGQEYAADLHHHDAAALLGQQLQLRRRASVSYRPGP